MEDPKLAIISAIARDIERRLSKDEGSPIVIPAQTETLRALLESMLLACPSDPEIRLTVETFARALFADLESEDGKVIPINRDVAISRRVGILQQLARLRTYLDALRC